jgi:hypothetical protein
MPYIARVSLKPKGPPLFPLGQVVATPGALELMHITETSPLVLIARHVAGDWGDCHPDDVQINNDAVREGFRVMSVYRLPLTDKEQGKGASNAIGVATEDDRVWVITEADRSVTTILLPEEY